MKLNWSSPLSLCVGPNGQIWLQTDGKNNTTGELYKRDSLEREAVYMREVFGASRLVSKAECATFSGIVL
jgi:hypothetical protein